MFEAVRIFSEESAGCLKNERNRLLKGRRSSPYAYEEDAVIADAEAEEALEVAGEGLDAAGAGVGVAMKWPGESLRRCAGGWRGSGPGLPVGSKSASPFFFGSANLVHGEAEISHYLLEGNALTTVAEILVRGAQGAAVFLGQFLFLVVDHDFEEIAQGAELGWRQKIDEGVNLLALLLEIEGHGYLLSFPLETVCQRRASCFRIMPSRKAAYHAFLFFIKAADGLELQAEILVGAALVLAEKEHIRTHLECSGELADDVESRLRGTRFIARELDHVHTDTLGQLSLSEAVLPAEISQALREIGGNGLFRH